MSKALDRLVSSTSDPETSSTRGVATSPDLAKRAQLASLAPSNTVPRSSIAIWISSAYSPHLATLSLPVRLRITSEVASLFGRIGYRRKEAFVLRELAALCAEGVAGRSIEIFPVGTSGGAVGTSVNGIPSPIPEEGADTDATRTKTASIVRTTMTTVGNDSIVHLSERVCAAFGIQVAPKATRDKKGNRMSVMQGRALEISEEGSGSFGWPGLQVGVLKDAIAIAESLPGELIDALFFALATSTEFARSCRRDSKQIIKRQFGSP